MKQALINLNKDISECGPIYIDKMKRERKDKELNDDISKDKELNELIKQRNAIYFRIQNDSRQFYSSMDTDPNHVQEALNDRQKYVENYVQTMASYEEED